jgi:hypothetical protein
MRDPCALHDPEAALAMRAALAPSFMSLRRILVQLCGLMLLSGSHRAETHDGIAVTLAALKPEFARVEDALREAAAARPRRFSQVTPLRSVAAEVGAAMRMMEQAISARGEGLARAEDALALLMRAQRRLLAVSDDRNGMAMVGFSHACCCGSSPPVAVLSCNSSPDFR